MGIRKMVGQPTREKEPLPDNTRDISTIDTGRLNGSRTGPHPTDWGVIEYAVPAARARNMNAEEWFTSAIDQAKRQRIDGTLRFHGVRDGLILYGAPMRGDPTREYRLTVDVVAQHITCSCDLHRSWLPCGHVGAAMLLLSRVQHGTAERATGSLRQIDQWWGTLHG